MFTRFPTRTGGRAEPGERAEVKFGSAGSVVIYVNMRWLDLPVETFASLREAIEEIKALGYEDSAPRSAEAVNDEEIEETS